MNNTIRNTALLDLKREVQKKRLAEGNNYADQIVADIFANVENIVKKNVFQKENQTNWSQIADNILTSRVTGYPIMLLTLACILWLTISGANVPSAVLSDIFFRFQDILTGIFIHLGAPDWLHGVLILGAYRSLAWVVSVMLPPMAIFFPLFTLLEDLGYLPRVSFNLDSLFKKAKACGKQSLTMCMGFGCNAAGVTSCRIIDSPRERLIAILTNNFVPCNGRFPALIAIGMIFGAGTLPLHLQSAAIAGIITGMILLGIAVTFVVSWVLSHTLLKGEASSLVLELPPYRKPKIGSILYRSFIDRTVFVLRRAVVVAAPAGAIIWLVGNVYVGEMSLLAHIANFLDPLAFVIGLDGFILLAFILGLPANEIVFPILIMGYLSSSYMIELENLADLQTLLVSNGWTWLTALCTMLFSLLHWPCATTLLTTLKETGSKKWSLFAFLIPTVIAFLICFAVAQSARLLGLA
ncbi:MAG: ferrous iron transporter B [Peptococcaceae bacterium]|nr:ferrous iron transporter B [Peptococcaceae bacterium]